MDRRHGRLPLLICLLGVVTTTAASVGSSELDKFARSSPHRDLRNFYSAVGQILQGQEIFRFDTFGDETFWADALRLHEAIAGAANGGVGPGVSPTTAFSAGLKGLWTHSKGGYFHDGRFAALGDVVKHYDRFFALGLSSAEKADLAEYLKSLRQRRELARSAGRRAT